MALRADSFSSVAEVVAFTRHLLDGQSTYNSTTRPTSTEVEKIIDRASGVLNTALANEGFSPSSVYANSTAKLACDDWVAQESAKQVELTQRGTGYSAREESRIAAFNMKRGSAYDFICEQKQGFIRLGIAQSYKASDGLAFTGLDAQSVRTDPTDTSLEQPKFTRGQWDDNT
jgi:hypothetical protein